MKLSEVQSRRVFGVIGILQIAIILLVLITAVIHLQRGIGMSGGGFGGGAPGPGGPGGPPSGHAGGPGSGPPRGAPGGPRGSGGSGGFGIMQLLPLPLSTLFILNGIGYLVLIVALYLPLLSRYQRLIRWLLIIFAAVTFVMYFLVNGFHFQTVSLIDKVVEVALIVLLLIEDWQSVHNRRSEVFSSFPAR